MTFLKKAGIGILKSIIIQICGYTGPLILIFSGVFVGLITGGNYKTVCFYSFTVKEMQWIANIYVANHFSHFGFLQSYCHVVLYFFSSA